MDQGLVRNFARHVMLRYGVERLDTNGPFNIGVRDVVLWKLLASNLPALGFHEMLDHLAGDKCFSAMTYTQAVRVQRIQSKGGLRFESAPAHPKGQLAKRGDYLDAVARWEEIAQQPVAAAEVDDLTLTPATSRFQIVNEGFGGHDQIEIHHISSPSWLHVVANDRLVSVTPTPPDPGIYTGILRFDTTGGAVEVGVTVERLNFRIPDADEVDPADMVPDHPGVDGQATLELLKRLFHSYDYTELPGGVFVRPHERHEFPTIMRQRIQRSYLESGNLPFPYPLPSEPRLVDKDGTGWDQPVSYTGGFLTGLADLFLDYEAEDGLDFVLRPAPDGFRFTIEQPDYLREMTGYRYWITGHADELVKIADWKVLLHKWLGEGEVNVLVSRWSDNEFTEAIRTLHHSGMLTAKTSSLALDTQVRAEQDDSGDIVVDPLRNRVVQTKKSVTFLWRQGDLLDGVDPREEAQSGAGEGKTLPLTPAQKRLALDLMPLQVSDGDAHAQYAKHGVIRDRGRETVSIEGHRDDGYIFRSRELMLNLRWLRTAFVQESGHRERRSRFVRAEPQLKERDLTPEQVNLWADGICVTHGGWMQRTSDPEPKFLRQLAEALSILVGEPVHHSQLRQLAEAYLDRQLDGLDFMNFSREACGWAGDGYRRPHMRGEPEGHNLEAVARSLLDQRILNRNDFMRAARRYLRTPPEKLRDIYDKVIHDYW